MEVEPSARALPVKQGRLLDSSGTGCVGNAVTPEKGSWYLGLLDSSDPGEVKTLEAERGGRRFRNSKT